MTTIRFYLANEIYRSFLTILLALLSLFVFFSLVEDTEVFNGWDSFLSSLYSQGLQVPIFVYNLIPIAILIGFTLSLSKLAETNVLIVFRSSGLSSIKLLKHLYLISIPILISSLILNEFIIPESGKKISESNLRVKKDCKFNGEKNSREAWFRELTENDCIQIIHVSKFTESGIMEDIILYEFDKTSKLDKISIAKEGKILNKNLYLHNVQQIFFENKNNKSISIDSLSSDEPILETKILNKHMLKTKLDVNCFLAKTLSPEHMSIFMLKNHINYLKNNKLQTHKYNNIFWKKLLHPILLISMISFSAPISLIEIRGNNSISVKVFFGIFLGISFFMINQYILNIGLIFNFKPWFSMSITSFSGILLSLIMLYLMENKHIWVNFLRKLKK